MRLTIAPEDQLPLKELVGPRAAGVHYSDLIKLLQRERDPGKFRGEDGEWTYEDKLRLEVGHTFEEMLSGALNRRHPGLVRPAPIKHQGVICSPDGWIPELRRLEEWKATWASTKRPLLDFRWWWFYQIACYAHVLQAEPPAILRVFYVNGDYSRKPTPDTCVECGKPLASPHLHCYQVSWYPGEPEEKWTELVNLGLEYGLLTREEVNANACVTRDPVDDKQADQAAQAGASRKARPRPLRALTQGKTRTEA